MIFKPFYQYESGCASYVLGCGGQGLCAVVDPLEARVDDYLAFAEAKGMRIALVLETHVHADHRSGARELARRAGAEHALFESADVTFPFRPLRDDEELTLGNVIVRVIHTPGHTPESVCYVVTDRRRADAPWFVLTGDTLFVGSVGRPDLPGRPEESAAELFASICKLLMLPEEVEVYPAHFAGSACGAGMSGKPSSTLAFEKRFNPLLAAAETAFVDALRDLPAKPDGMDETLAFNRGTRP